MDDRGPNRPAWPLALLLAYALAGASWGLFRTPLGSGEARDILAGREVLAAGAPARGTAEAGMGAPVDPRCGWPAAVALAPAAAAWGDRLGGIPAARLAGALMGLCLVPLLYRVGQAPRWGRRGLLVAATFAFLGVPLQLVATVHPRVPAALLLGLAMALAERSPEGERRLAARLAPAALAGASLALAAGTGWVAALFAVPLALSIALTGLDRTAAIAFALGVAATLAIQAGLAGGPAWPGLPEALEPLRTAGRSAGGRLVGVLDGLAMPLLLATFALFHRDGRGRAAAAMAVAGAAFLVPFVSPGPEDAHTATLLSFVVLAPAAGVGVAQMGEVFAAGNPSPRARPLFTAAVLLVVWVFGVHEMRTLRREEPDLSPAVAFLRGDGAGGRTVLVESDSGSPEWVYRYYLEAATPPARVVPIARADAAGRREALRSARPDYVVLDEHHSDRTFGAALREYLGHGFAVAATYRMPLPSGQRNVQVLRREAP